MENLKDVWEYFSQEHIDMYMRVFDSHDEDSSGSIDMEELGAVCKNFGADLTMKDLQGLVRKATSDEVALQTYLNCIRVIAYLWEEHRHASAWMKYARFLG